MIKRHSYHCSYFLNGAAMAPPPWRHNLPAAISKGLTVKSLPNGSGALPQTECLNKGLISLIGGFNPSEKY